MGCEEDYKTIMNSKGISDKNIDPVKQQIYCITHTDGDIDKISNINCNELQQVKKFFTSLGSQFAGILGLGAISNISEINKSEIEETVEKLTEDLDNIRWLATRELFQAQDINNSLRTTILNGLLTNLDKDREYLDVEFILYEDGLKLMSVSLAILSIILIFIILNFIKFI
tara:strand:+ start:67 stop:579 length:513 start_codon:yes stop_codon:yes gene_type:complete